MYAVKLKAQVTPDPQIHLQLPADAPQGEAEVIVLMTESVPQTTGESLEAFFEELDRSPWKRLSKEEIDRYIAEERANWE